MITKNKQDEEKRDWGKGRKEESDPDLVHRVNMGLCNHSAGKWGKISIGPDPIRRDGE